MKPALGQFLRFCLVGCLGFAVDAGTTIALKGLAGLSAAAARVGAFLIAATVTWALNRRFTFGARADGRRTWLPYLAATACGATVNVAVYLGWLRLSGNDSPRQLAIGVALGSVAALGLNFGVSRRLVFRGGERTLP